jgi:hypothetical protein
MATLHIFGDSFFEEWPYDHTYAKPQRWQDQLATKLGVNVKFYGLAGSAVDYTIKQYHLALPNIKSDDYVIIGITNASRIYSSLQEKDGSCSALMMSDADSNKVHGPHWKKALEVGVKWFMDTEINEYHILDFLHAIEYNSKSLVNKPLVLECFGHAPIKRQHINFNNINFAIGFMYDPCYNEFKTDADKVKHQTVPGDDRANHLSPVNHDILAVKLYNYFNNNEQLNLTAGFAEKIISIT